VRGRGGGMTEVGGRMIVSGEDPDVRALDYGSREEEKLPQC